MFHLISKLTFDDVISKYSFVNGTNSSITLLKFGIEFRRGTSGGGNQLKQPYLAKFIKMKKKEINNFPNTDIIHSFGYYIGNYPNLSKSKILDICKILNSVNF